jgi:hypothetical protein
LGLFSVAVRLAAPIAVKNRKMNQKTKNLGKKNSEAAGSRAANCPVPRIARSATNFAL